MARRPKVSTASPRTPKITNRILDSAKPGAPGFSKSAIESGRKKIEATPISAAGTAAECGAAEVFEPAVDGLGGAVAGSGPVEVGEDVVGAAGQGAPERA